MIRMSRKGPWILVLCAFANALGMLITQRATANMLMITVLLAATAGTLHLVNVMSRDDAKKKENKGNHYDR